MKNIIIFTALFLCSLNTYAQSTIKGTLLDENKQPVPSANVILLSLPDSTLVKGAISNEKGVFEFFNVANPTKLALKITHLEYKDKVLPVKSSDLGTILLEQSFNELGEVVISVTKPIMKQQGTIISTNIAETSLKNMPYLGMVLDFLPGTSKSFDGSGLQVFGKSNPVYYINNRRVRNMVELDRIRPEDIERIDIETEPGAEYDNSVGAIIRIVIKKKQGDGLSGNVSVQPSFKKGINMHAIADLNYRTGKTDFFATIAPNHNYNVVDERGSELSVHTNSNNWQVKTSDYQKNNSKHIYGKVGFAHEFNEKHFIGASVWQSVNPYSGHTITEQQTQTFNNGIVIGNGLNTYDRFNQNRSIASNAYYEGKLAKKLKMQTEIDYSGIRSDNNSDILEKDKLLSTERNIKTHSDAELDFLAIRTTFNQELNKGAISYGFEGSTLSRSENYHDNILTASDVDNKELKSALFVSYSFPWGKTNIKTGLRYEYTNFEYFENNQKRESQSRVYRNVLPNISFSFPWDKTNWSLSYIRKIRRPAFYELSDYSAYSSPFMYNRGNPNIVPQLSEDINLLASYKNYSFSVNYSYVKDGIYTSYGLSSLNPNVVEKTLRNFDDFQTIKMVLSAHYKVGIWMPKFSFTLGKQFANGVFEQNDPIFGVEAQNQFIFSQRLFGILMMNYRTKGSTRDIYYESPKSEIIFVGVYAIPKLSSQIFLGVGDVFNTNKDDTLIKNPFVTHRNYVINNNSRVFFFGFTYEFNSTNKKYKGQGISEEEKNRL